MILLIFSQQWVKAKLSYFKQWVRRFLGKLEMTRRCLVIVRRTTKFWHERYVEDRRTASKEWRDIDEFRPNAKKYGPNALVQWRDAFTDMPKAVSGGRNAGKKRREVQKRWREVSFFRRGVKKLTRNAIALKLPAPSFSLSNFLFCVCLAHARRRGLGTPAATSVALKIVPLLQIKCRNAGKKRREVQKRRREVSFFRRGAKKLRRNAIDLRLSVLSFSLATILFCVCLAHAGQRGVGNPAAAGVASATDSIKPLHIGDTIPEALWNLSLQMIKAGQEGSTTVTLNDYKGKLIILDFWATWCSSCLATIPKIETLQQQFQKEIAVIPLTYENAATALPVMQRNKWTLPSIIQGELFKQYFPHRFIPHYIWIKDGRVYGVTDSEELTSDKISLALKPSRIDLKEKRDLARNPFIPIDRYAAQQGAKVYTRSMLTGFIEGTGGSGRTIKDDTLVFYQFNRPIIDIYRSALNIDHNRILLGTTNPEKLLNRAFNKKYLYAYQLFLPADAYDKMIGSYVTQDLNTSFGINGRWESVKRKCYVIKDMKGEKGNEKEGTLSLTKFLKQLNYSQQWYADLPIFINEASKDVKITLPARATTLKRDIPALKELLASYNLQLVEETKKTPMFILSDYHN